jgi:hypothetical protein
MIVRDRVKVRINQLMHWRRSNKVLNPLEIKNLYHQKARLMSQQQSMINNLPQQRSQLINVPRLRSQQRMKMQLTHLMKNKIQMMMIL